MRPVSREYDENEHAIPWDFVNAHVGVHSRLGHQPSRRRGREGAGRPARSATSSSRCRSKSSRGATRASTWRWPDPGLGGAAVAAAGTPEQKERFLLAFRSGKPKWAAMAITEPGCGSDSSAIQTTAVRDGDQWVLNGDEDLLHGRPQGADGIGRVRRGLGDGRQVGGTRRDQGVRRRARHAGHHGREARAQARHSRLGHRDAGPRGLSHAARQHPRQRRGPEDLRGLQGRDGDVRRHAPAVAASAIGIGRAAVDFVREALENSRGRRFATACPRRISPPSSATSWRWRACSKPRGSSRGGRRG